MRFLLLSLSLLMFAPACVYGQQQYSEGACILLLQQIDRFSQQPQNSNYRNAKREYERYCNKPALVQVDTKPSRNTQPADPTPTQKTSTAPANPVVQPVAEVTPPQQVSTEVADIATEQPLPEAPAVLADTTLAQSDTAAAKPQPLSEPVMVAGDTTGWTLYQLLSLLFYNLPMIAAILFALLLAVFLLTSWFGLNLPGFKGVFAEYKLNRLLRWRLPRQYQHFRKLKLHTAKDESVLIDHLVLSRNGIFVIAVKSDRGRITGNAVQANWTRQYFGRAKHLMNPLHQNFKNIEAVKHLLELRATDAAQYLYPVITFSRVAQLGGEIPSNVMYVDDAASYIKQFTHVHLTEQQFERFNAVFHQASTAI